ncbi:hypothetical protein KUCAC02_005376 [Chaenocephalus aceratus]|uniref:Uncharacterized protein n=1 Tax=Chaenocephalus aceratus TaxID=36190 RepID=A0ACB9WPU4_CHAAC|nr:hypothetical protein KUCAC02_005376 [Chaenocephalus aceratus]
MLDVQYSISGALLPVMPRPDTSATPNSNSCHRDSKARRRQQGPEERCQPVTSTGDGRLQSQTGLPAGDFGPNLITPPGRDRRSALGLSRSGLGERGQAAFGLQNITGGERENIVTDEMRRGTGDTSV